MIIIFYIVVLIFSVIVHEIAHGFVALKFGDTTAKDAGRLTLNPMKHIDPFGSILFPMMMAFLKGPVFGWAKPVPYNPNNLRNPKRDSGLIAAAGPLTNMALAVVFAILARLLMFAPESAFVAALFLLFNIIIQMNLALAFFNLLPIPPLDGSGILFSLLPRSTYRLQRFLLQYGFIILIIVIFAGLNFLGPLITSTHSWLVGVDLTGQ